MNALRDISEVSSICFSFRHVIPWRLDSMGNFFAHLCPNASIRAIPSLVKRSSWRNHNSDTSPLCLTEEQPDESPLRKTPVCGNCSGFTAALGNSAPEPEGFKSYMNFPFLKDDEVGNWIVNTRFMFILRGPPGSGKSYISECIRIRFPTAKICSADDFWYLNSNGLEYQFDLSRISEAHQWCQNRASDAARAGCSPLVIDNTNIRSWETRYYTDLARKFNYTVIMVTPQTPWRFDPDTLALKNVHFVGLHTVEAKVRNFEHVFPLYYGWLWPGIASAVGIETACGAARRLDYGNRVLLDSWPLDETQKLLNWAWDSFITVVGIPEVLVNLTLAMNLSDNSPISDIVHHWCSATTPPFGHGLTTSPASGIPHITAKYARFGRAPGAERYGLSGAVTENLLGRLFTVQVTGLFFSLRTVGVRIRLPSDDLVLHHLWDSDDQAMVSSVSFQGDMNVALNRTRPSGCRAHVTLALAPDVSAVETGFDLLRVVDAELSNRPGQHVAIIPGGSVRCVTVEMPTPSPERPHQHTRFVTSPPDHDYVYVLDLDVPQHHRVLFAGVY